MSQLYFDLIDKEKNIYELAQLYPQNRREVSTYLEILQDPSTGLPLTMKNSSVQGKREYQIKDNVIDFTESDTTSEEWKKMNEQFMNYHKSLSVYTLINSAPINNSITKA